MSRRGTLWRVAAALFTFMNVAGVGYALVYKEPLHAALHVVLLAGTYVVWRMTAGSATPALVSEPRSHERLDYLQQSVDALAIEVERMGEAQRFNDKLRAKPSDPVE